MALSKPQKKAIINEITDLLQTSKMTVAVNYQGTKVKSLQELRRKSKETNTTIKVVKNRLVIKAINSSETHKNIDTKLFNGQLLYAFNSEDEVAPAQVLAEFSKIHPNIQFIGAISAEGKLLDADKVKALASLPSKNILIAQVIDTLTSPLNETTNALSGNLHSLLDGVRDKASATSN